MNKKKIAFAFVALAVFSIAAYAAILIATVPADVTVSEAISTSTVSLAVSAFPGETQCEPVSVSNAASVDLNVLATFTETSNLDAVDYTQNTPFTQSIAAGTTEDVDICFTVATDSPVGLLEGDVTIERVA